MQGSSQALIFLSFVIVCVTQVIISANAQQNISAMITETCSQTQNQKLCVSTLNSDPRTPDAQDVVDLGTILVFHVHETVVKTQNHILGLLRRRDIQPPVRQRLLKCMDLYNTSVKLKYVDTISSLGRRDYNAAQRAMNDVQQSALACPGSFAPPIMSPISDDTKDIDDISKVAFDILRYINSHAPTHV